MNNINLGRVMAIVSQSAHRARAADLEDAQHGIEKQSQVRKDVKAKLKALKKDDEALGDSLENRSALEKWAEPLPCVDWFFCDESEEVPKELAKNAQARKSAQQLDVDAEEQLAELQQDVRDVTESFDDSNSVVDGIQTELQKLDQAAFGWA